MVAAVVNRGGIVRRHDDGRVPVKTIILRLAVFPGTRNRADAAPLHRVQVDPPDVPTLGFVEHDRRIVRIDEVVKTVAATDVVPIPVANSLIGLCGAGCAPRPVVLQSPAHVVGVVHVDADLVELRDWQGAHLAPGVSAIPRFRNAAVTRQDQMFGVLGIDPQVVVVGMHPHRRVGCKRAPTVARSV